MMRRSFIILSLLLPVLCGNALYAQIRIPGRQLFGKKETVQSISLTYANSVQSSQQSSLNANLVTNNQAINGISYNNGAALTFRVSSRASYNINISAEDLFSTPTNTGRTQAFDIRDFIYYQVIANTTGGTVVGIGNGSVLGTQEKCILAGCPATIGIGDNEEDQTKTFSVTFRIQPGYSVPPGTYRTRVMFTATYE